MSAIIDEMHRFMEIIKYEFKDIKLLNKALTHSSYINEKKKSYKDNNERLEFLGDAILDAVISEYLYNKFNTYEEGKLTRMRASIVCESSLAECAGKLHLGDFFLLGKGEENTGGRNRSSILADTLEALFGAVYLDSGWEAARKFILEKLKDIIDDAIHGRLYPDYKTRLQEIIQANSDLGICYQIVNEEGPDHNKTFYVNVSIGDDIRGGGSGRNKKEAEQNAAKAALSKLDSKKFKMIDER